MQRQRTTGCLSGATAGLSSRVRKPRDFFTAGQASSGTPWSPLYSREGTEMRDLAQPAQLGELVHRDGRQLAVVAFELDHVGKHLVVDIAAKVQALAAALG